MASDLALVYSVDIFLSTSRSSSIPWYSRKFNFSQENKKYKIECSLQLKQVQDVHIHIMIQFHSRF